MRRRLKRFLGIGQPEKGKPLFMRGYDAGFHDAELNYHDALDGLLNDFLVAHGCREQVDCKKYPGYLKALEIKCRIDARRNKNG